MQSLMEQPTAPLLSAAQMREILAEALAKNFTGVGQVSFPPGEELRLLIQLGHVREVLVTEEQNKVRLQGEPAELPFQSGKTGQLVMLKSPGRLLTFERACFDRPAQEVRQNLFGAGLEKLLDTLEAREAATLVWVRWPLAQAYVVIAGGRLGLRRAVVMKNGQGSEEQTPPLGFLKDLATTGCQVELYQGGLESDPWTTLHLNLLFEFFCSHLFDQYGYLTGKVMVNSILKNILIYASQQDWDLSAADGRLFDQTLFPSADAQRQAYRAMLTLIQKQMQSFAGPNVVSHLKSQSLDHLNSFYLDLWKLSGLDV